jgi:hypothetical protein
MMNPFQDQQLTRLEQLEYELLVRDFTSLINDGCFGELDAFLGPEVVYRPALNRYVIGRGAVLSMLEEMHYSFETYLTSIRDVAVAVAVASRVVLAEQTVRLKLPGEPEQRVMGFASYQFSGFQISDWHQLYA